MELSKNKKNEKNKNRFVFLSFLPKTDAFSTRHRLEVQRPCFLTDLRELRSDNQDVPPAQVQQDAFAYNNVVGSQLPDARYGCFLGSIFLLPNVLPMCYLALCRYLQVAVHLKLPSNSTATSSLSTPVHFPCR
jgi:hypothetical protein